MARTTNSLLKGMSGKIGDLIIYEMDGKTYARSKPTSYKDSKSPLQLNQRQKLILVNDLLRPFKDILKKTFFNKENTKRPYLRAQSYNLKYGTTGFYPDLEIDYKKAFLCKGSLPMSKNVKALYTEGGIVIEWENIKGYSKDTLFVMLRQKNTVYSMYKFTGVERSEEYYLWKDTAKYKSDEIQLWIAFRDPTEEEMSDSLYVDVS